MDPIDLAVLGVGSLRRGPAILASIAVAQPEPSWTIRLYDTEGERLDIMDRLARRLLIDDDLGPRILSSDDPADVIGPTTHVIVSIGINSAQKWFEPKSAPDCPDHRRLPAMSPVGMEAWFSRLPPEEQVSASTRESHPVEPEAEIVEFFRAAIPRAALPPKVLNLTPALIDLLDGATHCTNWPPVLSETQIVARPLQLLRWIKGEDRLDDLLRSNADSPVAVWLRGQVDPFT